MNYFRLILLTSLALSSINSFAADRIVTLAPSIAEIIADLEGEKLAAENIVGVSEHTDFPKSLKNKKSIGPYFRPNLELILSLKPDLVIATQDGNPKDLVEVLKVKGIRTLVVNTQSIQQIYDSILEIGQAIGKSDVAQKVTEGLKLEIEKIKKGASFRQKKKILIQLEKEPLIVAGGKSFLSEMIELVGAQNVYGNEPRSYPRVSLEDVIQKNPDWILCLAFTGGEQKKFQEMQEGWAVHKKLAAVQSGHVRVLLADTLVRPGPRMLEGIRFLEEVLYGK